MRVACHVTLGSLTSPFRSPSNCLQPQAFRGIWRIQERATPANAEPSTRLSYALFVRPQQWMPIALIQSRIEGEVVNNLTAVRNHAQQMVVRT